MTTKGQMKPTSRLGSRSSQAGENSESNAQYDRDLIFSRNLGGRTALSGLTFECAKQSSSSQQHVSSNTSLESKTK